MSDEHRKTLTILFGEIETGHEAFVLRNLAIRAGLMDECPNCAEAKYPKSECPHCGHGRPAPQSAESK